MPHPYLSQIKKNWITSKTLAKHPIKNKFTFVTALENILSQQLHETCYIIIIINTPTQGISATRYRYCCSIAIVMAALPLLN